MSFEQTVESGTLPEGTYDLTYTVDGLEVTSTVDLFSMDTSSFKTILVEEFGFPDQITVSVWGDISYWGYVNWQIEFHGYPGDVGEFIIDLTNIENYGTEVPTAEQFVDRAYSPQQFFEPVPADMLRVASKTPAVTVQFNQGLFATCPRSNCDYIITDEDIPTVETNEYNEDTNIISFTLSETEEISDISVELGDFLTEETLKCSNIEFNADSSTYTCTPELNSSETYHIPAGDHELFVTVKTMGILHNNDSVTTFSKPLTLTDFNPKELNPQGGQDITVQGDGFPWLEAGDLECWIGGISVEFKLVSNTELICIAAEGTSDFTVEVTYNGESTTADDDFSMSSDVFRIDSLDIDNAPPGMKTDLIITGEGFGTDPKQLSCRMQPVDPEDPDYPNQQVYKCSVWKVTDTEATIVLPGGQLGLYRIILTKQGWGDNSIADAGVDELSYRLEVTSLSHNEGSLFGGLDLSIEGVNFNPDCAQNRVKLSVFGNWNKTCHISECTATTIECTTSGELIENRQDVYIDNVAALIVEQYEVAADCDVCDFQHLDTSPRLEGIEPATPTVGDTITLTGTNLDLIETVLIMSSESKEIVETVYETRTAEEVTFVLPNVYAGGHYVYLHQPDVGFSSINQTIETSVSATALTPASGFVQGAEFQLDFDGTPYDAQILLNDEPLEILEQTPGYIRFRAFGVEDGDVFEIKDALGESVECVEACTYAHDDSDTLAKISTVTTEDDGDILRLTIAGTGLDSADLVYLRATDDTLLTGSIETQTETELVVELDWHPQDEYLLYVRIDNSYFAGFDDDSVATITLERTLNPFASLTASYDGGNILEITGHNLSDDYDIFVCANNEAFRCIPELWTNSIIQCQVPRVTTLLSDAAFNTAVDMNIPFTVTGSGDNDASVLIDGDFGSFFDGGDDCFIEIDLGENLIVDLKSIRYVPKVDKLLSEFEGMVLQGLVQGESEFTDLYTLSLTDLLSGFNYFYPEAESPYYSKFRFVQGDASDSQCKLAEISLTGKLYLDIPDSTLEALACPVFATIQGDEIDISTMTVTYSDANTPLVTTIIPNSGTAAGGTEVTITGSGFSATVEENEISFDGVPCEISSASETEIVCTSGARASFVPPETIVTVNGSRSVVPSEQNFVYIDAWSSQNTWGGEHPPQEQDLVYIPAGQNILLDESTPIINTLIIEGRLIFADTDLTL